MNHVLKIASFNWKLKEFLGEKGYMKPRGFEILRYFECLAIRFFCDFAGKPRQVKADILPRIEASALRFLVNVNVEEGDEETEEQLSKHLTGFFTCAWSDFGDSEPVGALNPDGTRILFFVESDTLYLRISD